VKRNIEELDCSALKERVGSRLLDVGAPLAACLAGRDEQECAAALAGLRNPWAIEDDPGAFHTSGWYGAHVSAHSPRVVAAESAADIAAAVDFAREHGAGLVIKGTGHIRAEAPDAGSYVNETDYHQPDWQRSFWGDNYARLLRIKHAYDPGNLFRVHHGVGSEPAGD
jgi:FAD/FMN-containing dehydrogenase